MARRIKAETASMALFSLLPAERIVLLMTSSRWNGSSMGARACHIVGLFTSTRCGRFVSALSLHIRSLSLALSLIAAPLAAATCHLGPSVALAHTPLI